MQTLHQWTFDGVSVKTKDSTFVKWYDHKFFLLIHNGKKFNGEIMHDDTESGRLKIKINHRVFEVKKSGELDELIASLGLDKPKIKKLKELQAPMPGRVLQIFTQIGQEVQPGDALLSLEAMKMENVLKAEGVGVVKEISAISGEVVDKGSVLISFE
jgi:biotin carboxyl carrier protein